MWWPVVVLILLCYYYFFVASGGVSPDRPLSIPEPVPPPSLTHVMEEHNNRIMFRTSNRGQSWEFDLDDAYYFQNGQIHTKDECFGKPNGTAVKAQGKSLYLYLQRERLYREEGAQAFQTHVQEAVQNDHIFYFTCSENHIDRLSTCPPGQVFDEHACISVDVCSDKPEGTVIADSFDKRFYYVCPKGRFQCPSGTFFLVDACRPESSLVENCANDPTLVFPINSTTLVSCLKGRPQLVICPPGHVLFENRCIVDSCLHEPDGTRIPFPTETMGPFRFSTGYYVCHNKQVHESHECPSEWNEYDSKGDNLGFLPQVFHEGKCSVPEFCTNVTSNDPDVVVPAHDFTKNVKNFLYALAFDQAMGYKCQNGQKVFFYPPPGQRIFDFHLSSACDAPGKRAVVLGGKNEAYYACDQQMVVPCPPDTFFDGETCRPHIPNAHRYKNMDMFRLNHLAHGWMKPWNYTKEPSVESTCRDPESVYLHGFNVCAHPECVSFPFLKQLKAHIQLDERSKCVFKQGKISKLKTARRKHFNFWKQRSGYDSCIPGSRIKSGHLLLDSVLFATCDASQPFVFCPSALTSHIAVLEHSWACMPRDEVFESVLKANTSELFLENHLARVVPSPGARLKINGQTQPATNGIDITTGPVEVWSDREARLIFKTLVNHPPNTYFENRQPKVFKDPNRIFVTRYGGGSTVRPIDFVEYDVEESVSGFQSDAR